MIRIVNRHRLLMRSLLALLLVLAGGWAQAMQAGRTADGVAFVSGGIGEEETRSLRGVMPLYSLWLTTAAQGSGAYLAGVQVRILDAQGRVVLLHALQGPWLLVDLPSGHYRIEAQFESQMRQAVTTIHPGDHHQVVLYFDAADADVLPREAR